MIELTFLTTDPDEIELCRRYWQLDHKGGFSESIRTLLEQAPGYRERELNQGLFGSVLAHDTRRRCPTCGTPGPVPNRESYLAPVQAQTPCRICLQLKKHLGRSTLLCITESCEDSGADDSFTYPVAAIALLHALGGVVHPRELREGFSVHDCVGLAPAHLGRLVRRLSAARVIEKVLPPSESPKGWSTTLYRLASAPALEQDIAKFNRMLVEGRNFSHHGLMDLWLDYAIAEGMAFICSQSAMFDLPINPNDLRLGSALHAAMSTYSIGEVWSVSRLAIQEAASLVENGYTAEDAAATLAGRIAWRCRASPAKAPMPEPIVRTIRDYRTELGIWFDDWYGLFEHVRGHVIADLFSASHNTRTPHMNYPGFTIGHQAAHVPSGVADWAGASATLQITPQTR